MALHEVEIWNRALSRIGDNRLGLDAAITVSGATAANPVVLTRTSDSLLANDDLILVTGMDEMTEINGRVFRVAAVTLTACELVGEDGLLYNAETTGGQLQEITNSGNSNAQACFDAWTHVRDEILESHPWKNCVRRSRASRNQAAVTITGASQANPVRITAVAHGYTSGDLVLIASILGTVELNDRWFIITQVFVGGVEDPDLFDILTEDEAHRDTPPTLTLSASIHHRCWREDLEAGRVYEDHR